MAIGEELLSEFDVEMAKTRKVLERIPADKAAFVPHPKSMSMGKLAAHTAQLTGFGLAVLTSSGLDLVPGSFTPLQFESVGQVVKVLDEGAAKVRVALAATSDDAWSERWRFAVQGKAIHEDSRYVAYRGAFLNHMIHHRAQLGVYLRLNGIPVPATYGPTADEQS